MTKKYDLKNRIKKLENSEIGKNTYRQTGHIIFPENQSLHIGTRMHVLGNLGNLCY